MGQPSWTFTPWTTLLRPDVAGMQAKQWHTLRLSQLKTCQRRRELAASLFVFVFSLVPGGQNPISLEWNDDVMILTFFLSLYWRRFRNISFEYFWPTRALFKGSPTSTFVTPSFHTSSFPTSSSTYFYLSYFKLFLLLAHPTSSFSYF